MATVIDGSASVTINNGAVLGITSGTAVSASGTSIDFTGIPSWVKRVTVMFKAVGISGGANYLVQIGSGSITTTGYVATTNGTNQSNLTGGFSSTAGFGLRGGSPLSAISVITLITTNTYVNSSTGKTATTEAQFGAGDVTLGGALDRVRITTTNGTDTFNAGTINILYEG
jgi:hypothetical protein